MELPLETVAVGYAPEQEKAAREDMKQFKEPSCVFYV